MAYNNLQLPKLPTLPESTKLPALSELNNLPKLPTLPRFNYTNYKRTNQQVSPFSDYNDPTQINSFADVILNTLSKNDKLKTRDYGILSDIGDSNNLLLSPFAIGARALTGTFDLMRNTVVEPIKQKNFSALGINTLVNLGESLDILASPIKGLVMDGPEGLIKGSVGRVNYDVDTGNFLLDMAGEILLDPFNWITFGSKAAISGGVKSILAGSIDDVAQAVGGKFLKEGLEESTKASLKTKLIRYASRELYDNTGKFIAQSSDEIFDSLFRAANRLGTDYFDESFLDAITNKQIAKLTPVYINNLSILKGINGIANLSENVEKIMFEGAMYTNFIPIEQLKNIKQWGIFKNYTNQIITEVGSAINGFINPTELTKLANYNVVTKSRSIMNLKLKVNQILKQVGIENLSYIDIDNAFSDTALEAARNVKFAIEEYSMTKDFDTFIKKVASNIVPEDIIADSKDIYLAVINTLDEDLKLIETKLNKDGIKVFSNISETYQELKNNIINVYEYDKAYKLYKNIKEQSVLRDVALTKHQKEFVAQYKNFTFNYISAYEKTRNKVKTFSDNISDLTDINITHVDLEKVISKFIKDLSKTTHTSSVTKDVQNFLKDFIESLKKCETVTNLNNIVGDLFDRLTYHIDSLNEVTGIKLLFKSKEAISVDQIVKQRKLYTHKAQFINKISKELRINSTVKNPNTALNNLFAQINKYTTEIPDDEFRGFLNIINEISNTQNKFKTTIVDTPTANKELARLRKTLSNIQKESNNAVEYANYLINRQPAIQRYKNIESQFNKSKNKLSGEYYEKQLAEARKVCAGGMSAFNKAIEEANKKQLLSNSPVKIATNGLDKKQTVFNTKNVAVSTIATPKEAEDLFKQLFLPEDSLQMSSTLQFIDRVLYHSDIAYAQGTVEWAQNISDAIENIIASYTKDVKYFELEENLKDFQDLIEDIQTFLNVNHFEETFNKLQKQYEKLAKKELSKGNQEVIYTFNIEKVNEARVIFNEAKQELSQISIIDTRNKMFIAGAVNCLYAAKDENLMLLYNSLSSDIGIATEMHNFVDPNSIASIELRKLIDDPNIDNSLRITAEKFWNDVQQYKALENLVKRMSTDEDIPEGAFRAIMSSLESFKNMQLGDIDIDRFNNELAKRINNFIYGVDNPISLSIENLLTEAEIKIQKDAKVRERYLNDFTEAERKRFKQFLKSGETHISEDDTFVQEVLIRLLIPDEYIGKIIDAPDGTKIFLNKEGRRLYISDCETSSKYGSINEIAIKPMGATQGITFKVAYHDAWEIPQADIIKKMFPDNTYEEALIKYKELYNPDSALNKKAIEDGTTIFCNSEKEMLEEYKRYLNQLNLDDEVIMHNGTDFDYPVIKSRAYQNKVFLNQTKVKLSDSLVSMKNNTPLIQFDSATRIKVNNYIKQYLSELPEDSSINFLSATSYSSLDNLDSLHKQLIKDISGKKYNETLITSLKELQDKYYTLMDTNNRVSVSAQNILISKEFFQTQEGQDILLNEVKKAKALTEQKLLTENLSITQKQEYQTYLQQLNDTLELAEQGLITNNISRMMYINRFEGDPALGFWKIVDLDTARNYMDIPDDAALSLNELKAITNFTRPLKNSYDAIRNTSILAENKKAIKETLEYFIEVYSNDINIIGAPSWLKYIRVNPDDYKTNYVLLQKLYNKYTRDLNNQLNATKLSIDLNTQQKYINKKLKELVPNEEIEKLIKNSKELIYNKQSPEFNIFSTEDGIKEYTQRFKDSIITDSEIIELNKQYKKYIDSFNNAIEKGLKALGNTIDATPFTSAFQLKTAQQSKELSDAVTSFVDYLDTLKPAEQLEVIQKVENVTDIINLNIAKQIVELPDEQLLNQLLTNSMLVQLDTKFINQFDPYIINKLLQRKDTLSKIGIEIDFNQDLGIITLYPNKSVAFNVRLDASRNTLYEINGIATEPNQLLNIDASELLDFLPEAVQKQFKIAQNTINKLTNNIGAGTNYQIVDRNFYRKVYNQLPDNIKNNMLDIEYFMKDELFNKRTRFNTTVIGSQKFCSMYGDYIPGNFIKGYMNSFMTITSRASDKANYMEMILNKDFSINNGFINELSFEEMRKMLEDAPEFNLACLVYNKSGNIELVDLKLNTEVDFQFAKKNNAVILPYHVFANAYQIINSQMYEEMNPVVKFITKAMHMYKRGYLMSGGMIMRNTIDTFAKNINIAQGDMIQSLNKTMEAMKLYSDYNKTLNDIFKASGNQRINKDSIRQYFELGIDTKMTYDNFSFIHEVLNSGALIGEVKALDNYRIFSKARKEGIDVSGITDLSSTKYLLEDRDAIQHSLNGIMKVNNDIENIQRLSAYMLLQEQGLNFTQSVYKVAKDHFNYSMKSPREKLIELIIPFYTFKLNNLQYWAEALADNPWIAGLFEDIMTPIWDFDDVDENELKYNRSLQYRLLSGNLQLADNGLTLKLNPSASDAFKLMTNPLGEIYNSTFALYTFATDAAMTQIVESTGNIAAQNINQVLNIYKPANPTTFETVKSLVNLLPYGAVAQRAITGVQYAKELGNILPAITPSIFGRTKQYEQFSYNKQHTSYNRSGKSYSKYRKIARPRKTYPRKNYQPYRKNSEYYPINFKKIYVDGMYSVPNISTYTAQANRYYHLTRINKLSSVSIYDKLYTAKGKSRWDAMLQPVSPQNLKYVIKNTIHYK